MCGTAESMSARSARRGALLVLAATLSPALTAGADWPHLRGPDYDGVSAETRLADSWPTEGPSRLWSRELGQGHSGFIVAGGKLFTQRQDTIGQYLLCMDPADGRTLWETRYAGAWQARGAYPGPYATPTWYRGKVYYASPTGLVGCADGETGAPLWSVVVRDRFGGKGFDFGYAATPLVEDGRVILPVSGAGAALVALDAEDGRTLWQAGSDHASYCPAFPFTFAGRRCVAGYLQNTLLLVEMESGKVLHRRVFSGGYDEHAAWPIYREPHLLLTAPFRAAAARWQLQAGPDGAMNIRPDWTSRELSNDVASSILYGGHVDGFDLKALQSSPSRPSRGVFRCLDWSTGETRWSTDRVGHAAVLVADGKLFLLNDSGALVLARADSSGYDERGRVQLFEDEVCWTPPMLWEGRLFVRSPSRAVCLYVGPSEERPTITAPASSPPARHWRLKPEWLLSREREYPNDAPSAAEAWLWLGWGLLVFAVAAPLGWLARRLWVGRGASWVPAFLGLAFVLGLLGPNVLSAWAERCLFTWPASLYAAFQIVVRACRRAEQRRGEARVQWSARLTVAGFLLACYGYFALCRMVGFTVGWAFLVGFPLGFPFAVLAARAEGRERNAVMVAWTALGFVAFFAGGQGLLLWKAAQIE